MTPDRRRALLVVGWWLLAAGAIGLFATALILWQWMHEPPDAKTLSALMTPRQTRLAFLVASGGCVALAALGGRIVLSGGEWPRTHDSSLPSVPTDYPGLTLREVGWGLMVPSSHFELSHKALKGLHRRVTIVAWTIVLAHVPMILMLAFWPWFRRHATVFDNYMISGASRVVGWIGIAGWLAFNAWTDYVAFARRRADAKEAAARAASVEDYPTKADNPESPGGSFE